ncbi:MAG: hypothetical protein F6K56_31005 [Moorea sp. SIO3G5]|nr:hypothetical protein [Moorena sp. SIO3G5]
MHKTFKIIPLLSNAGFFTPHSPHSYSDSRLPTPDSRLPTPDSRLAQ